MPIFGVGIDIEKISRIESSMKRPLFMKRVFTPLEREYIAGKHDPHSSAAGIFCAKEAFFKALGTGILGGLLNVEVRRDKNGAPCLRLYGALLKKMEEQDLTAHVSISHTKEIASALVILESKGESKR